MTRILANRRKPDCTRYPLCLDAAARTDQPLFCEGCEWYEQEKEWYPPAFELFGCLALCRAICVEASYDEQQPQRLIAEIQDGLAN